MASSNQIGFGKTPAPRATAPVNFKKSLREICAFFFFRLLFPRSPTGLYPHCLKFLLMIGTRWASLYSGLEVQTVVAGLASGDSMKGLRKCQRESFHSSKDDWGQVLTPEVVVLGAIIFMRKG
jgi:hypothetical protein